MKHENDFHYYYLDQIQLELYEIHLKMTKNLDFVQFNHFNRLCIILIKRSENVFKQKRSAQNIKLEKLITKHKPNAMKKTISQGG